VGSLDSAMERLDIQEQNVKREGDTNGDGTGKKDRKKEAVVTKNPSCDKEEQNPTQRYIPYKDCDGNSGKYKGTWKNGRPEGKGQFIYDNSDIYVGGWKKGRKFGEGMMMLRNRERFQGIWKDNSHADGKITYNSSKENYQGAVHYTDELRRHGVGTLTLASGATCSGRWKDGYLTGPWKSSNNGGNLKNQNQTNKERYEAHLLVDPHKKYHDYLETFSKKMGETTLKTVANVTSQLVRSSKEKQKRERKTKVELSTAAVVDDDLPRVPGLHGDTDCPALGNSK